MLRDNEFKYNQELLRLEGIFTDFAQRSELDVDNFNRFKQDKFFNIETLQRSLRETKNELNSKNAMIDDLSKSKDEMNLSVKN